MDFDLTAEQQAVRTLARDFARSEVAPVIRHFDEAHAQHVAVWLLSVPGDLPGRDPLRR